ncbi:MAG: helix-hairpin-helix domain-containing protein [Nitrospira sp.]|nr:helix-hairpin-helix domain-containing protein [Nitrospira sp.]
MIKDFLTVSGLFILLSLSSLQPNIIHAEPVENSHKAAVSVINVNTASAVEIAVIPGLGEKKSQAIIKYREKHGPFTKAEDLKKVGGIGNKLFEKIKPYVAVK